MIRAKLSRLVEPRAILMGTAISLVATLFAFVLAFFGFGNVYYASVFMPFLMMMCLAIAWFMTLRRDRLARRPDEISVPVDIEPAAPLFAPRDNGIIPRAPMPSGLVPAGRKSVSGSAVLLWAAMELGVLAAVFYSAAGIGARFY
jgi:cation transporter-like permease